MATYVHASSQPTHALSYISTLCKHTFQISCQLRLDGTPLHLLPAVLLALLLEVLALLVCAQASQLGIALFALELVGGDLPLLGLLFLVNFADLGDLLVTCLLDPTERFGAEVGGGGEVVWQAQEVVEERHGGGVVRGELQGEVDALLGLGVVETVLVS